MLYYGPFDGHDVENLIHVLGKCKKRMHQPVLLHMVTNKGKGYAFAEERPDTFHGVSKFDVATGEGSAVSGNRFPIHSESIFVNWQKKMTKFVPLLLQCKQVRH